MLAFQRLHLVTFTGNLVRGLISNFLNMRQFERRGWDLNPRGLSATDLAGLRPTRLGDPGFYAKSSKVLVLRFWESKCLEPLRLPQLVLQEYGIREGFSIESLCCSAHWTTVLLSKLKSYYSITILFPMVNPECAISAWRYGGSQDWNRGFWLEP